MKETIILKSANPAEYGDLEVECRVIPTADELVAYVDSIPEERKVIAYKNAPVQARKGIPGEKIYTTLITYVDGKAYILSEEENPIKEQGGVVVRNINSTSNEEYVVKTQRFIDTYVQTADQEDTDLYTPVPEERLLSQVDENIIFYTSWGSKAVCLKGSYIVTYSRENKDFNTIEQGAFNSTYTISDQPKTLKI